MTKPRGSKSQAVKDRDSAKAEDAMPPPVAVAECLLLAHLRGWVRLRMQGGESLAAIAIRADVPLGTLRQWTYQARSGDAFALERAISKLGGAEVDIPGHVSDA